jgi:hypothetical protein
LVWIDAISLQDLFGPDARDFASTRRVEDCRARRGELKRIPIAARRQGSAACTLLGSNRRGEEVVRLEPCGFGVRKPKGGDKLILASQPTQRAAHEKHERAGRLDQSQGRIAATNRFVEKVIRYRVSRSEATFSAVRREPAAPNRAVT